MLTRTVDHDAAHPTSQAVADASIEWGDGNLRAALTTSADFGCVQFEAKK